MTWIEVVEPCVHGEGQSHEYYTVDPPKEEECDGSNTCEATEHVHGCYQSKREDR